jgi:biopolymer transport protein ExbD
MLKSRFIRNRGKRRKKSIIEMDITSLLDILVILLVFLIKSYDSSNVTLNVPKGIQLPLSESQSINTAGVMVQVSPTTIWVDDVAVLNSAALSDMEEKNAYDMGKRRIVPLFNELVKKVEKFKEVEKAAEGAPKFSGIVNLIVDKTIKYSYVKKLMFTCAEAGFQKYKFVVRGEEQF